MNYLLDTCVVSELVKPRPDPVVAKWVRANDENALFLSVMTLGELEKGIALLGETNRARWLRDWFDNDIWERFHGRILPIDEAIAFEWGRQQAKFIKIGRPRPVVDLLLAATAISHGMTIATRNTVDFAPLMVPVFNPWEN